MKYKLALVILISLCATAAPVRVRASSAVFNLVVDGSSICTAFAVEGKQKQRVLITAGHCAEAVNPMTSTVYAYDAVHNLKYPVILISAEHEQSLGIDYAIFRYTDWNRVPPMGLPTTTVLPEVGDVITVVEGPAGYIPFFVRGHYSGRLGFADSEGIVDGLYFIQVPGTSGASGSPVMNSSGEVWGIVIAMDQRLPGMMVVVRLPLNTPFGL